MGPEVLDIVKGMDFAMLEKDVFPKFAEQGKLYGYKSDALWFDTGTFENLENVKKNWKLS